MKRSSTGGKQRPTLTLVLLGALGVVLLLQLSGWGRQSSGCQEVRSTQKPLVDTTAALAQQQTLNAAAGTTSLAAAVTAQQPDRGAAAAPALLSAGPPYKLPKLIHQTVINKSRLSCEEKQVIDSWKRLNPNHTHHLWDDAEMRQFMQQHYPELLPVPYDLLLKGTERSDLWRVLVLNKLGGVYADMDVECLKPIDEWNAQHGDDAAVLLGIENYDAKRSPHRVHVNNWAMAAVPGHPLLARFPGVVVREIQRQFFGLAQRYGELTPKLYEAGVLNRTGPAALTTAMYEYFESVGLDLNKVPVAELEGSKGGVIAGGVRVLPTIALSSDWKVADARAKGVKYTCADVAAAKPQALVCHMFWGSWRTSWRTFKQRFTYEGC